MAASGTHTHTHRSVSSLESSSNSLLKENSATFTLVIQVSRDVPFRFGFGPDPILSPLLPSICQ